MRNNAPKQLTYQKRAVLFLDFLGFKELIKATETGAIKVDSIVKAIDTLRSIGSQKEFFASQQVTQFSDCVVVSYRCDERSAAFDLVSEIGFALVSLAEQGLLVRGGVAVGDLVHTDDYLFGPAMIQAYEIESKCAIFPRVLVSTELLDIAGLAPAEHHRDDEERAYVQGYLVKDTDGCHYVDYVSWNAVINVIGGTAEQYGDYLESISEILKKGLAVKALDVRSKYGWLFEKYIESVNQIVSIPEDSDWVSENKYVYQQIKNLPSAF